MFKLTKVEKGEVVTNCDRLKSLRYSPHLPYAFSEHGAIMAATILNSPKAAEMSVFIVRTFVHLRSLLTTHKVLAAKLEQVERKLSGHDHAILELIKIVKPLTAAPAQRKRSIGFIADLAKRA